MLFGDFFAKGACINCLFKDCFIFNHLLIKIGSTIIMTPEEFQEKTNVSRETLEMLVRYVELLQKWQQKVNLISPLTRQNIWFRHLYDSAQLVSYIPEKAKSYLDMGSGAGFPALVIAVMIPTLEIHIIESNRKKCLFMNEAARIMKCRNRVHIHPNRIEEGKKIISNPVNILTARALAPLDKLLILAAPFKNKETTCFFLKGKNFKTELATANHLWHINHRHIASKTDPDGAIIIIKGDYCAH